VKDSRPSEDGSSIRRRRQCEDCGARFTTFERVQLRELTVLKSGDRREPFDRAKLERSVATALRKRPVPPDRIDRLVSSIQRQLEVSGDSEVTSTRIGEMVMDGLKAQRLQRFPRSPRLRGVRWDGERTNLTDRMIYYRSS
jgi:transcriptional repressor NrdR